MSRSVLASVVLAVLCGCGAGVVDSSSDAVGIDDALSTVTAGFVTVQRDARRCAAPACGGYFVTQVNHSLAAIYVAALDFSQSNLDDGTIAKVTGAPDAELLLYGKLGRTSRTTHTRNFIVLDAYRGMPGRTVGSSDHFYSVASNGKQCLAAPCNALTATKLNSTAQPKDFTTLSVASAAAAFVDQTWLSHRVLDRNAIVAASFTSGTRYPTGTESVLDSSQVFLHLPESVGPCPMLMPMNCTNGQVNVVERNADRCLVPAGCANPGICSMMLPACPDGYTLTTWRDVSNACPHAACDPSWL